MAGHEGCCCIRAAASCKVHKLVLAVTELSVWLLGASVHRIRQCHGSCVTQLQHCCHPGPGVIRVSSEPDFLAWQVIG